MEQAPDSLRDSSKASNAPRLIERFRAAIRSRHYSRRTEKTYWFWILSITTSAIPLRWAHPK